MAGKESLERKMAVIINKRCNAPLLLAAIVLRLGLFYFFICSSMKKLTKKAEKTALLLALPLTICIISFLMYDAYKIEAPAEDFSLYEDAGLQHDDSIKLALLRAAIDKELDSIQRFPNGNWSKSLYNEMTHNTQKDSSSVARKNSDSSTQNDNTNMQGNVALQGPSALFTRRYSLQIGKPVPVSVLWKPDSALQPTKFQLLTITLNDITDNKAGFTLSDPSAVLLYSGANYAVHDKISIEDENHDLHISVLQVHSGSVIIDFTSSLTDNIVSRLKVLE